MAVDDAVHFEIVTTTLERRRGDLTAEQYVDRLATITDQVESPAEVFALVVRLADLAAGGAIIAADALGIDPGEIVQRAALWFANSDDESGGDVD